MARTSWPWSATVVGVVALTPPQPREQLLAPLQHNDDDLSRPALPGVFCNWSYVFETRPHVVMSNQSLSANVGHSSSAVTRVVFLKQDHCCIRKKIFTPQIFFFLSETKDILQKSFETRPVLQKSTDLYYTKKNRLCGTDLRPACALNQNG